MLKDASFPGHIVPLFTRTRPGSSANTFIDVNSDKHLIRFFLLCLNKYKSHAAGCAEGNGRNRSFNIKNMNSKDLFDLFISGKCPPFIGTVIDHGAIKNETDGSLIQVQQIKEF